MPHIEVFNLFVLISATFCFFVFDADAKYIFLTTRKMALDDANFLCTLADAAALGGILLYAFLSINGRMIIVL